MRLWNSPQRPRRIHLRQRIWDASAAHARPDEQACRCCDHPRRKSSHSSPSTPSVRCAAGFVSVADEKADQVRVGLHVHVLKLGEIETVLAASERPTESNDWPAPAHIIHALRRGKHRLIPASVVGAGVFVEDNFDRLVQVLACPRILTRVRRRGGVFPTSQVSDVVHVDVLVISLILGVDASDALADGCPGETRFLLVRKEDDDSTHASAGSIRRDVFEAPAHELVGVSVGLEAL